MYAIFLRSQREPILVDDTIGYKLKDQWLNGKLPKRVEVGDWAGDSEQIKGIKANADGNIDEEIVTSQEGRSQKTDAYFKQIDQEYKDYRKAKLKLSPADRAKNLTIAKLVWEAHTERPMPDDIKEQIIARQQAFFEEFPRLSIANPICYRDIVQPLGTPDISNWKMALLRLAESACAADKRESREVELVI